jgi:hypothetical protein
VSASASTSEAAASRMERAFFLRRLELRPGREGRLTDEDVSIGLLMVFVVVW